MPHPEVSVNQPDSGFTDRVTRLMEGEYCSRIAAKEAGLWGPEATPEASIRLGWTNPPAAMSETVSEVSQLRDELSEKGVTRVVLCGMG